MALGRLVLLLVLAAAPVAGAQTGERDAPVRSPLSPSVESGWGNRRIEPEAPTAVRRVTEVTITTGLIGFGLAYLPVALNGTLYLTIGGYLPLAGQPYPFWAFLSYVPIAGPLTTQEFFFARGATMRRWMTVDAIVQGAGLGLIGVGVLIWAIGGAEDEGRDVFSGHLEPTANGVAWTLRF